MKKSRKSQVKFKKKIIKSQVKVKLDKSKF